MHSDKDVLVQEALRGQDINWEYWSQKLGKSVSQLKGWISFYTDFKADPTKPKVCQGTSCTLAQERYEGDATPVYCLGRCYAAPNAQMADGQILNRKTHHFEPATETCPLISMTEKPMLLERMMSGPSCDIEVAIKKGAYQSFQKALELGPQEILKRIKASGLRGRGGAGFPVGIKWQTAADMKSTQKHVVINGDEGDPSSFMDRLLMEDDPHAIIEGVAICAWAIGAQQATIYIRSEYPHAQSNMQKAIDQARDMNFLGPNILGSSLNLEMSIHSGHGSYVCGEETALINAIEGRRGEVRIRPPFPAQVGLNGKPTVVNNVETIATVPLVLRLGESYQAIGTEFSKGSKLMCLDQGFKKPGVYEVPFGMTLNELIQEAGGPARGELIGLLLGGPMGSVVTPDQFDTPICFQGMSQKQIILGHGGLAALCDHHNLKELLNHWIQFMVDESCGKCAPCSLGSKQLFKQLTNPLADPSPTFELMDMVSKMSLCAFGQLVPVGIKQLCKAFPKVLES